MTTNFLATLTDEQLAAAGWTNGQIREIRKYVKIPTERRNAHQRNICRKYSDLKRKIAGETEKKQTPRVNHTNTNARWTPEMCDLLVELYVKYNGGEGAENAGPIIDELTDAYPEAKSATICMSIAAIKRLDYANACHGLNGSAMLRDSLAAWNERNQSARFAIWL